MQNYTLPDSCTYKSQGSSEGTQTKFFMDGKWFKQDLNGYEGEVECNAWYPVYSIVPILTIMCNMKSA